MKMNIKAQLVDNRCEVVLHCKANNFSVLTSKVQQVGIFTIDPSLNLKTMLTNDCVKTLYPYFSQIVSNKCAR